MCGVCVVCGLPHWFSVQSKEEDSSEVAVLHEIVGGVLFVFKCMSLL